MPLYVVGAQSARAAAEKGLRVADMPAPDVAALAERLHARLAARSRVLYLAGRDRRSELEAELRQAGHIVTTIEVYAAEAREAWDADEAQGGFALRMRPCTIRAAAPNSRYVLPRAPGSPIASAKSFTSALSEDAAAPIRRHGARLVRSSESPHEEALFAALLRAVAGGAIGDP